MPRKVRQLLSDYQRAGFQVVKGAGKGSHRKLRHPLLNGSTLLSGKDGADAKPYQEHELAKSLAELETLPKNKQP